MMTLEDGELLMDFLSGYFHEDWSDDDPSPDGVIDRYIDQNPNSGTLKQLARAIRSLLQRDASEEALEGALFEEFGCYYVPSLGGVSAHAWLEAVAKRLDEAAAG